MHVMLFIGYLPLFKRSLNKYLNKHSEEYKEGGGSEHGFPELGLRLDHARGRMLQRRLTMETSQGQ